ncbi:MAG: metallophosphoesterase [Opitutaceae bacterium]
MRLRCEMISCEVLPGIWLDGRLALWIEHARLLVVSDLHWGYAASHQASGNLLPSWGDAELAARLNQLIEDYRPAEMIWLGDSLHTLAGRDPAEHFLHASSTPVTIVSGNHDRRWKVRRPRHLAAHQAGSDETLELPVSLSREGFFFHHGHLSLPVPAGVLEITGHHHPAVAWNDGAGGRVKLPALIASNRRLILPAFSPWAAGSTWNALLEIDERLFAIAPKRIFAVSRELLLNWRRIA